MCLAFPCPRRVHAPVFHALPPLPLRRHRSAFSNGGQAVGAASTAGVSQLWICLRVASSQRASCVSRGHSRMVAVAALVVVELRQHEAARISRESHARTPAETRATTMLPDHYHHHNQTHPLEAFQSTRRRSCSSTASITAFFKVNTSSLSRYVQRSTLAPVVPYRSASAA